MKLPIKRIEIDDLWLMTERYQPAFSMDSKTEQAMLNRQDKHFEAIVERYNKLFNYRCDNINLEVGMRIRYGKHYAEKYSSIKEGDTIDLIEGYFDEENGITSVMVTCPAIWDEDRQDFDSIYQLFGNDMEDFLDCEIVERDNLCKNCKHCYYQHNNENQEEEFRCEAKLMVIPNFDHWGCDDFFECAGYVMTPEGNIAIGMDCLNKTSTGGPCIPLGRSGVYYKLQNSFNSLANEYRIGERWREHFESLFDEIPFYKQNIKEKIEDKIVELKQQEEFKKHNAVGYSASTNPNEILLKMLESFLKEI